LSKSQPQIAKTQTLITVARNEKKVDRTTYQKWSTKREKKDRITSFTSVERHVTIRRCWTEPHASDQIQPLDVVSFAMLEKCFSASKFRRLSNPQSNKIVRILEAWFAASAPHHNFEVLLNVGLVPVEQNGDFCLHVEREHARRVRG
jgi:hypothetical protein